MESIFKILITQQNSRKCSHYLKNDSVLTTTGESGIWYTFIVLVLIIEGKGKWGQLPPFIKFILNAVFSILRKLWMKVCESSGWGQDDFWLESLEKVLWLGSIEFDLEKWVNWIFRN